MLFRAIGTEWKGGDWAQHCVHTTVLPEHQQMFSDILQVLVERITILFVGVLLLSFCHHSYGL